VRFVHATPIDPPTHILLNQTSTLTVSSPTFKETQSLFDFATAFGFSSQTLITNSASLPHELSILLHSNRNCSGRASQHSR
jgi:hypothetical protein